MKANHQLINGFIGKLLLVIGSVVIVVLIAEGIFRQLSDAKSADDLVPKSLTTTLDLMTQRTSGCLWRDTLYPHPYLDYVRYENPKCLIKSINSKGFPGPEFPPTNDPNTFDILIMGGSVANNLAVGVWKGSLIQRLEDFHTQDGRPIKVYSSAIAGWKQPQQLLTYLLYQDLFDAIVSIEGFNEMNQLVNSSLRLFAPFFGTVAFHAYSDINLQWKIYIGQWLKKFRIEIPGFKNSYLYSYLLSKILPALEQSINREILDSLIYRMLSKGQDEGNDLNTYLRYIKNFETLTTSNGQKYAFFFQPVPGIAKPLTETEKQYLAPQEFYERYQEVVSKSTHLKAPIFSLLEIFKNTHEEIYSDAIHSHIDEKSGTCLGYQLIIDRIVEILKTQWSLILPKTDRPSNESLVNDS